MGNLNEILKALRRLGRSLPVGVVFRGKPPFRIDRLGVVLRRIRVSVRFPIWAALGNWLDVLCVGAVVWLLLLPQRGPKTIYVRQRLADRVVWEGRIARDEWLEMCVWSPCNVHPLCFTQQVVFSQWHRIPSNPKPLDTWGWVWHPTCTSAKIPATGPLERER